ncbi:MAG: Flp family type IVb pilin [Actinomycetota bacterium]
MSQAKASVRSQLYLSNRPHHIPVKEVKPTMLTRLYVEMQNRLYELRNEEGATAAEYALLVALIAVAIIVGAQALGTSINEKLQGVADTISGA